MEFEKRQKALDLATKWHEGQKRKDGKDYITHPIAVAEIAQEIYTGIIKQYSIEDFSQEVFYQEFLNDLYVGGILHDVIEDTEATKKDISDNFGYSMAATIELLSKAEGQTYFDFIMRLVKEYDFLPIYIKMADLKHNMSDLNEGSLKDKYRFAYHILNEVVENAMKAIH